MPARDDDLVLAGADHQIGDLDRANRRRADLVDRVGGNLDRDPGADRRLARGRLARSRLEHLAHDHVPDLARIDAGPLEPCADHDRPELGRRQRRETAAELPEGGPDGGDDHGAAHVRSVAMSPGSARTPRAGSKPGPYGGWTARAVAARDADRNGFVAMYSHTLTRSSSSRTT